MFLLQATATQKVQNDLIEMLHIPKSVKFVSSVNRPNLFYSVLVLDFINIRLYISHAVDSLEAWP